MKNKNYVRAAPHRLPLVGPAAIRNKWSGRSGQFTPRSPLSFSSSRQKQLAERAADAVQLTSVLAAVCMAGFEVTLYGRFWGDHRGGRRLPRPKQQRLFMS